MKHSDSKLITTLFLMAICVFSFSSCKKDNENKPVPIEDPTVGTYNHAYVSSLSGFFEQRPSLLESNGVPVDEFIRISTDSS